MSLRPSRRQLRYSLPTLFVLMTMTAAAWLCAWWAGQVHLVRDRKAALAEIMAASGQVGQWGRLLAWEKEDFGRPRYETSKLPFWRYWIDDKAIEWIDWPDAIPPLRRSRLEKLFPEAAPWPKDKNGKLAIP